jgi:hypothetical protein
MGNRAKEKVNGERVEEDDMVDVLCILVVKIEQ